MVGWVEPLPCVLLGSSTTLRYGDLALGTVVPRILYLLAIFYFVGDKYKMSSVSVQEMVRPSEPVDLYYYDAETSKKQAFPTTQNTKYVQQFANLTGGSSVFTIPPQNGIQDVVCTFIFDGPGAVTGLALPSGWGYALIRQVSFRYGGSSQYFISGQQLLQNALRCQTSRSSCDDLLNLGGNYSVGGDLTAGNLLRASVVLRLPHNVCSGVGKSHPLPTDCLTQQVQITVELNQPGTIWTNLAGATLPAECRTLAFANFQVQQVMLNNQGDALARRVDLATKAYAFPCEFVQQEIALPLPAGGAVTLTGFRSGEVKSIEVWLTDDAETVSNSTTGASGSTGYNPFKWYPPSSVEMLYAGDVYARYAFGVGQLFNLINGNKSPAFDLTDVQRGAGNLTAPAPFLAQWLSLPFAQTLVDEDAHYILVHGKPITNGIVNLQGLVPPYAANWTLHISYVYNTTLLFSQGTCDYVF